MSILRSISKKNIDLKTIEKYGFLCLTLFCLIPVSIGYFYPTLDGPAHLYNSNLINQLLFGEKTIINDFIQMNPEAVPNWTGHFILAVFNFFLPSFLAEKIVLIIYIVGFAYSFRSLVKTIAPQNVELSFLIFPFIFSTFFFMGFYNFCLSLIVLFFTLGFWIRNKENALNFKVIVKLFLLIIVAFFSHVFVFGILLFVLGVLIVGDLVSKLLNKETSFKDLKINFLKQAGACLLASLIPLIFFLSYFLSRGAPKYNSYLSFSELTDNLTKMKMMVGLNQSTEGSWYEVTFFVLLLFIAAAIVQRLKLATKTGSNRLLALTVNGSWLVVAFVLFIAYFRSPEANEFGGIITPRIALLFYLFILIWLVCQPLTKWMKYTAIGLMLVLQLVQVAYYTKLPHSFKKTINEIHELSALIKPNSVVLPLNYSDSWLYMHLSNSIGTEKPMVILENYECEHDYFPLQWNKKTLPIPTIQGIPLKNFTCTKWIREEGKQVKTIPVDYIFVLGDFPKDDECTIHLVTLINEGYNIIYNNGDIKLYQIK